MLARVFYLMPNGYLFIGAALMKTFSVEFRANGWVASDLKRDVGVWQFHFICWLPAFYVFFPLNFWLHSFVCNLADGGCEKSTTVRFSLKSFTLEHQRLF
jgi:hypothetical protein